MKRLFLLIIICLSVMICSAYVVQFGERPEIDLNRISDDAFYHSHFYIKFDHALTEHLDNNSVTKDDDGILSFNLAEIDELNKRYEIREVKLLFNSPALDNRFKDRHRAWGFHLWFELQIDNKQDIREIISAYEKLDIITVAEPEYKKRLDTETKREGNLFRWTPNDPQLSNQWHYNNTGQQNGTPGADISLFDAWNIEKGNSDVIVAIIDSGVQYDHPDLSANMWSSIGYNFVNNNSTIIPGDHGTHVAGTVAAVNHNGIGVAGVAGGSGSGDGVRLMSCQVFTPDSNGGFHLAPVYAADNGAAISQNSWGYTQEGAYNQNVLDAIDYFNANGGGSALTDGITIFAAGNDETTGQWYPGCYSGAFSVAATNNQDKKSWYSTYDDWVDISAPGGETHQVTARGVLSTITGGNYAYYQGTSMACPHASGVAALIVSLAYGELTAGQVADILRDTTDDHYGVNPGYIGQLGTGRLNANAALLETQTYLGGVSNPQSFSANSTGMDSIELNWTKNADNDDVMIIWDTEGQFGSPQSGVFYNTGDFIPGGGTVLYTGSDTFFEHTGLQSGTTYYYKAFSYDTNGEYSFGRTTQATTDYEPFTLPFSEDFDAAATLPEFWEIVDHQGNGQVWQFGTISGALSGTSGNYAYLNSDDYGSNNSQNTDLITPTIDMSNYDDITLSFTHYFRQYLDVSSVTLSYSIDDGESWTTIQTWTETITNPTYFDQTIPQIAGQSQVRFKWNYTGTWGWYWCVDDIHISGSESLELLPPTDLSALAGDGVVELSWNAPESGTVQSYNIYRDDEDENFELIGSSSQSEYIDEYLINSLTYTYYVTAIYPEGDSEPSETIQATPLASPSELSAIYGDLFVELNWIAVANNRGEMDLSRLGISKKNVRISGQRTLEGYNLYRDSEQINTTIINNTNYIDTNVEYDTNYQYYVTAVYDEFGESVESNIVDIYLPNKVATPTFTPDSGLYTQETDITIQSATEGSTIMYRTSVVGSARDSWSDWQEYTTPITVPLDTEMDFEAYAQKEDWIESDTAEATYTVTGTVATPSFTPEPGLYTDATDVSIDTDTGGATVMYRTATDGGAWSDWQVFTTPITVPMDTKMDFEAYAEKADWADSDTAAATYTVTGAVANPTFTPDPGLYTEATDVSINTDTDGATVMYRTATDGGAWSDWQVFTTPITVPLDTEMDFEAYAQKEDWIDSDTAEATYSVTGTVATPSFTPEPGLYTDATDVSIDTDTGGATVMYRTATDGGAWSDWQVFTTPITVPMDTKMDFEAYAEKADWADSDTAAATYTITGTVATPTFTPEPGLYTEATDVSINTATDGATVMYRTATDGGAWTDWQEYTTPITVPLDTEMDFEAYAQKEDWLTSETSEANYIVTGIVATPEFDPEGGIFHEAQIVAINTETAGATIEYSFDGESWLEGDTVGIEYSTMLYARAYLENWADSEITEDMYYILNPPQDLVSDAGDGYVDLTWQAPIGNRGTTRSDSHRLSEVESHREENGVIGYNIYRDEELIDSVGLIHTYHDDEVENLVEYTYYVTALYPEGESLPSNTTTALPLPDIAYGDVDDNGIVEAYDAALVLQYAVGMDPIPNIDPRPWEDWRFIRADVNGDDMIRAYDASLILQYAIDIINVFPVQQPGRHEQPEMVDITWLIDDEHLYLRTDNTEALYAAEFIIPNPDNISFGEIEFNAQLSEYMTNTHTNEQGMHIAFAAAIPIEHSDYLLRVPYQSEEYEILTIDVVSNVYESSLEIEFSPTETDEPIELITTLHRAYPNPFNPETTIGFSLADAGHVTIEIYNIRGQKIRTLVNSEYVAGQHSVVWDGKDERGREASGGVYLYRFRSQEHIETKRMLLFK